MTDEHKNEPGYDVSKVSKRPTFTVVQANINTKGKKYAPIIGPLIGDVRDYGDGKGKIAMLSLPTREFQEYFDAIDALKKRIGFNSKQSGSDYILKILLEGDAELVWEPIKEWMQDNGDWNDFLEWYWGNKVRDDPYPKETDGDTAYDALEAYFEAQVQGMVKCKASMSDGIGNPGCGTDETGKIQWGGKLITCGICKGTGKVKQMDHRKALGEVMSWRESL